MVAVTLYLAVAAILLTIAYLKYIFRFRREGEAPYVPGHFLWGNGADFSRHAVHFLHRSQKALGDIFTIRLLNQYMTLVMDPHCFEQFAKEKNFDFHPIQKQVNNNVFAFELKNARKVISEAGKKVNGKYLSSGFENFASNLQRSFQKMREQEERADLNANVSSGRGEGAEGKSRMSQDGLRSLTAKTLFDAMFYTIFGRAQGVKEVEQFTPKDFHASFDVFHKIFNYVWLGVPVWLFPKACQALQVLCQQPEATDMMQREGVSEYIKLATCHMLQQGQSRTDIVGHNLVFLHVNYNTYRVNYWCVYHLLEKPHVREALTRELNDAIEAKRVRGGGGQEEEVRFTLEDFDKLPLLDSFLKETLRISSGVFMVRKVVEDTPFTMPNGQTYTVRKGDKVAMYPPAVHMDPEIFENPETFKYDRFVDAKFYKYGKELKTPLIGFGSLCPGKRMSMLQIKWFLINLLNSFTLDLVEGERTELNTKFYGHEILPPVNDVQVRYALKPQATRLVFSPRRYYS
ncbi:cytochrome P450 7A1-like [Babylonia areolata]|uniref:cytochrome P450 7A1-like n=1 Tax=Babylonia areolata TaxID=304850 RepID=UPI003FD568DD